MTNLQRHIPQQARAGVFESLKKWFKFPEQSASTTIWAATAEVLGYEMKDMGYSGWVMHLGLMMK
jgi:hypothetical protein